VGEISDAEVLEAEVKQEKVAISAAPAAWSRPSLHSFFCFNHGDTIQYTGYQISTKLGNA